MTILGVFVLCFIVGSLPIDVILNPRIKKHNKSEKKITLHHSPLATHFTATCLLKFSIGYGITIFAENTLYDFNELFFIVSLLILVTSHCWPIFNKFKQNKHPLLLITGICSAFYTNFIWIIPLTYAIFTILLNSQFLSYLTTLLSLLVIYSFIDIIPDNFLFLNLGIFIIFILLFSSHIFNALEGKSNTLYYQFLRRS